MLASPALRTPRTCPSSTLGEYPLSFTPSPRARRPASVRARVRTHTHTRAHARAHTLYVPAFCFPFPSSSFLLVTLQHLSPHPRSSFEFCGKRVSLSSFLPPFLPVSPTVFFSPSFSFATQSPDLSLSYPIRDCHCCCFFLSIG